LCVYWRARPGEGIGGNSIGRQAKPDQYIRLKRDVNGIQEASQGPVKVAQV